MRSSTCLALVLTTCAATPGPSKSRRNADFDWAITPQPGYPIISFNPAARGQDVIFKYDTPQLHENKTYRAAVYENDCLTVGDASLSVSSDARVDRELAVELDVDEATVSSSPYWFSYNSTTAVLSFCLRVDYYLYDESVNFHETNVTITIDLRAGFNLTNVNQTTVEALQYQGDESMADYPVVAYHCDNSNAPLSEDRLLSQGDTLQLCVEADSALAKNVYVTDILSLDLDQPYPGGTRHGDVVENFQTDALTTKRCEAGVCSIQSQLTSQWFIDADPEDVAASGEALLAFGNAGGSRALLRVPFVLTKRAKNSSNRKLQESKSDDMYGKFVVFARLSPDSSSSSQVKNGNNIETSSGMIALYVLLGVAALLLITGSVCILLYRRRRQKSLEEQMEEKMDLVVTTAESPPESSDAALSPEESTLKNEPRDDEVAVTEENNATVERPHE